MASTPESLYVTYVEVDRDLLKIWGQKDKIGNSYIERQLLQLLPKFNNTPCPNPTQLQKGMFCFAKFTKDKYRRARIISGVQNDSVYVLFVDYGDKDFVKLSDIRIQEGDEGDVVAKMSDQAEEYYLARISAPSGGWTSDTVGGIRRLICFYEFFCQIAARVGDQKIVDIHFRDEDLSTYLVTKQLATSLSLHAQRQMILSYCYLMPSEVKTEASFRDVPQKIAVSSSVPSSNVRASFRPSNVTSEEMMQAKYGKTTNPIHFSQPHNTAQLPPSRNINSTLQQMNQNITKNSYFPAVNPPGNQMHRNVNAPQVLNPVLNPLLTAQLNPLQAVKDGANPFGGNNNIIQILAQQVKQYIAEDNAKTGSQEEKIPHHYVNSVLEVGCTYNVIISYIDDGPWSFSIQLLSYETELRKVMDELAASDLIPLKPPVILGYPCIASSALYGNLCRGVVVSISHTAVKVYFVDFGNTEDLPSSSIYELPSKFFKVRVLSQKFCLSGLQKVVYSEDIKKFFKEVVQDELLMLQVTSLEDDNLPTCELYLKDKNIKRILNEKMREFKSSTQDILPKIGETENVVVTWVVSPQKFFVQLHKRDADLHALKTDLAEVETRGHRLTYQQLSVGFKCVCLYESDGNWYRAVITSVDSENAITVFYVDYGNTETVSISRLRSIDASVLINRISNQAIQCCLKGFENKQFNQELCNRLESLVLEKDFQMTVVSYDRELLCVQLMDNGKDISSLLLTPVPPKLGSLEPSQGANAWSSPFPAESNTQNSFEKQRRFEAVETHNKKDSRSSFPTVKSRQRNNSSRPPYNFQSFKSPVHSTPAKSKRRAEETWRNGKDSYWSEPKFNDKNSSKTRGFKQVRESNTWDSNNNGNYNINIGSNNTHWRTGGQKQERGGGDWNDGVKCDRSRGFNQDTGGWSDKRDGNFGDKKKFDENRGERERVYEWKFGGGDWKRFDVNKGRDDGARKFERNDNTSSARDKFEEQSFKKYIRKEDAAPPGSKFEDRVIHLGGCENGIVTYYFNPHEFFVQLLSEEKDFKKMMVDIQAYYSDKHSLKDPVQAGDIVIAQFTLDKVLYRAEVVKSSPVTVRYVDYGNQEPVPPKSIWAVDKHFLNLPKQAIRCRLPNVEPIGSDWPPPGGAMDKFFEFSEYKCTFLGMEGDMYEISLEDVETGKDVAEDLIATGHVRRTAPKLDAPKVDYSLLPNQILRLYVSHVESSSKFYVILNPKSLEAINNELKTFINDQKFQNLVPLNEALLKPEASCLSTIDGVSWYRGRILKTDGNKILVWFCDRGDRVEVTADKVKSIPDHLKLFQPQAVLCSLHGSLVTKSSSGEDEFKSVAELKHHLVSIVSATDESLSVVLYDENGQKRDFQICDDFPQTIEPLSHLPILSQKLQVVPSHAESPHEIYIQRWEDSDELTNLLHRLSSFYSEEKEGFDIEEGVEGTFVAAKSTFYESWYRGRLLSSSEEGLEVFYIDYGNRETLPRENVKKLDPSFLSLNSFCKKLSLDVEFNADKTEDLSNKFMELCQDKDVFGYFVNGGDKFISEFTINGERITHLLKCTDLFVDEGDKFSEIFSSEKSTNETEQIQPLEQEEQESTSTWNNPEPEDLKVVVTHIDSPNRFWVYKESMSNELRQFHDRLQESCQVLPDKENPQVDDIVGAVFSEKWYRAKVTNVDDNNLTVQFVDYGNTFIVDLSCNTVKELTVELLRVPVFATPYALTGTWSEDSTSKFEEIILQNEEPVRVIVLEESDPVVVDLLQNGNGRSIAEMLKERMHAQEEEDGDLCTVYISHSNSPHDFYIQREACTDTFKKLSERLSDAPMFEIPSSIEENGIYAAKYPNDGTWYRAKVVKKHGDDISVSFIDYGDKANVTEVRCLPDDILDIPNLAENCSLIYGNNCDSWSEAAREKFSEFYDRKLKMKVVVKGVKKPIVQLFDGGKNISEELETLCENDGRTEVWVSHAASPTDFYIRYVDDEEYESIAEKLQNGDEAEELTDGEKKPGTVCQARFVDDGYWYRAKILRNLDEGVEVFFIDFGNTSVAMELRRLPAEIEAIPPKALRCRLNLPEINILESVKEEFIYLTAGDVRPFRALIIDSEEVLTISLKIGGRILEETLNLDITPEEIGFEGSGDGEGCSVDDGKNCTEGLVSNETDEEKIADCGVEDFNDEKEIERISPKSFGNAPDNKLVEDSLGRDERRGVSQASTVDMEDHDLETVKARAGGKEDITEIKTSEENRREVGGSKQVTDQNGTSDGEGESDKFENNEVENEECRSDKMSSVGTSRGEKPKDMTAPSQNHYRKSTFSEKLVPGSISRGVSLEEVQSEYQESPRSKTSQSAPNTPKLARGSGANCREKVDPNDRSTPGCTSTGVQPDSTRDKSPAAEKILSGSVNCSINE